MTAREAVDIYSDNNELELLCADGFDDAILGICERFNQYFVVYDREKVIATLMERDGMERDDAEEWYSYNIVGAWVGDGTPGFLTPWDQLLL